jgi:hypothetical protein
LSRQLDIFEPPDESWWEVSYANPGCGRGSVWVIADSPEEAQAKADALLIDLGVHPVSDAALHKSLDLASFVVWRIQSRYGAKPPSIVNTMMPGTS